MKEGVHVVGHVVCSPQDAARLVRLREEYESGTTLSDLTKRYGFKRDSISRRAQREGWDDSRRHPGSKVEDLSVYNQHVSLALLAQCAREVVAALDEPQDERFAARITIHAALLSGQWDATEVALSLRMTPSACLAEFTTMRSDNVVFHLEVTRRVWELARRRAEVEG
ncbi:MAG: hypothetical protein GC208_10440 [Alphaproteobacteria bacterium]|nr:hypothetical protein [Alphaproteobacteria bacterium]